MKKDIYIIKNSVNDKVYIGLAKDAAERWLAHIYNAKYEDKKNIEKQVIHKAMSKYGIDKFHYEILEYQVENYDEREIYWIKQYNSMVPNGYNVSAGGGGTGCGCDSVCAIFKDEKQLLKCISEISGTTKTFLNIARKYGCGTEVISAINSGARYKREELEYPLRRTNYNESLVKQIRYSLKYELDLTIHEIAKKYSVDYSQVSGINNGRIYFLISEKYPLRSKRLTDLSKEMVNDIISDIINSPLSLSDIATKYNLSRNRISGINTGRCYVDKSLTYPLRGDNDPRSKSFKKFLDRSVILEIMQLLKTDMSVKQIAKKYGVSDSTIQNINNGRCKKYVIDGITYPIRKIN